MRAAARRRLVVFLSSPYRMGGPSTSLLTPFQVNQGHHAAEQCPAGHALYGHWHRLELLHFNLHNPLLGFLAGQQRLRKCDKRSQNPSCMLPPPVNSRHSRSSNVLKIESQHTP